jgi:hypothetical protein
MCSLSLIEWWITYFSQLLLMPQFSVPRLHIYAILHDFNSSLLTFLKGLLHENLACFRWPIYTDPCCSSRSFWYFQRETLDCFTFYLRTCCTNALTCVFNPNQDGWGLMKLWIGISPQHLKSWKILELMYTSKNILGVYLIKYFWAKNSIFSNYLAKKCRKPPVFGAVLCISANWRLICLL